MAKKILEILPDDGSKVSGGHIRQTLGLSKPDFMAAKQELKGAGMVTLGRGRGGSLSLIIGAEPPQENRKLSKAEVMAAAREVKESNNKEQKVTNHIREVAEHKAKMEFPAAKNIVITMNDHYVYFEIDGKMYRDHKYEYE